MPVADARVLAAPVTTGKVVKDSQAMSDQAMNNYLSMIAKNQAQDEANKAPVQGEGMFSKMQNAIAGSPQLQSGLMAAGLSLVMGGGVSDAISAGIGAVANWNQQEQEEQAQTTAQAFGALKQQSQVENSQSEIDYRSRLPDNQGVEIARINAGMAGKQLGANFLQMALDEATLLMKPVEEGGEGLSRPLAIQKAKKKISSMAKQFGVTIPGVANLQDPVEATSEIRPSSPGFVRLKSAIAAETSDPKLASLNQKQKDLLLLDYLASLGLDEAFGSAAEARKYVAQMEAQEASKPKPGAKPGTPAKPTKTGAGMTPRTPIPLIGPSNENVGPGHYVIFSQIPRGFNNPGPQRTFGKGVQLPPMEK